MLEDVIENGTGAGAKIEGVSLAGKTGSTQLPYADLNGTKDQWFVGYTGEIVGAVWLGYDKTDREHYLSGSTSTNVVPIFKAVMEGAIEPKEVNNSSGEAFNKAKEKMETTIKEQSDKLGEKLKEELPVWKEFMKESIEEGKDFARYLRDKWNEYVN